MFWLFVTLLWTAMILSPFVLLYLFLPAGRDCPRCSGETMLIHSRLLHPFRRVAGLRWCLGCGWEGIARNAMAGTPLPQFEVVPDDADEADDDAPWRHA